MEKYTSLQQGLNGISPSDLDLYSFNVRVPSEKLISLKLSVSGDKIIQNGKPIRAIGVNDPNGIYTVLKTGQVNYRVQHKRMADLGIKFVRVFGMLYPVNYSENYFGTPEQKERFYKIVEDYMDSAYENGIGVMYNVLWDIWWIAEYFGKTVTELYGTGEGIPISADIDTIKQMIADQVNRFKNHPALAGWECTNELNQRATYNVIPTPHPEMGTKSEFFYPEDVINQHMFLDIINMISNVVHENDPSDILISSGNESSGAQSSLEHAMGYYVYPDWGDDEITVVELPVQYLNPEPINTIGLHRYSNGIVCRNFFDTPDNFINHRRKAREYSLTNSLPKAFLIGEVGTPWWNDPSEFAIFNNSDDIETFRNACDGVLNSGCQLTFFWAWLETNFMVITEAGDANFAPNKELPIYDAKAEMVRDLCEKIKMEDAYLDPFDLPIADPFKLNQNGLVNKNDQPPKIIQTTLSNPNMMNYDDNDGITFDCWIYLNELDNPADADRIILNLSNNSSGSLLAFNSGLRIILSRPSSVGGVRLKPYISLKDELGVEKKYIPGATRSNPINLINGWNHLCLQVVFTSDDPNWGIIMLWNGMKVTLDTDVEDFLERYSANTANPSASYNPSSDGKITIFGREAIVPQPTIHPIHNSYIYGGIANLRFYRRSLSDQELTYTYLCGIAPRDYSLKSTSLDNSQPLEKLVFTFNNTYASSDGSQVFEPIKYNGVDICSLPDFDAVNQKLYWQNNGKI